jgi:PAS domain S-box-containing protein
VASGLTAFCLPALIALTGLVASNQLWLWLRRPSERLHLSWAFWCGLGAAYIVARYLQHTSDHSSQALLAVRMQYAIGLGLMLSLLLVIRDQVHRRLRTRVIVGLTVAGALAGAALFIDDVVATGPAFVRTDALGQQSLDVHPGALTVAYILLLVLVTSICLYSIVRHGDRMTRARRLGILVTLGAVSAAGLNDIFMAFGLDSIRLTEFATVAVALSADHLMVHDYHRMVADMEGLVSERTAALRAVTVSSRRAEESFRSLIDASPDAIIVTRAGFVVFANAAAASFLGRGERAALIGSDAIDLVHVEDRMRAQSALDAAQAHGRAGAVQEERYVGDGDAVRVAETVRVPLLFEGGESVAAILRDVTERRQMEEKLQFAERMASIGTLAAGVAHEINNPMSYVLANLEFLREALVADPAAPRIKVGGEDIEALIAEAEDGARRVIHIVRDLKAFSRKVDDEPLARLALEDVLDTSSEMALVQIRHRARLERQYSGDTMVLGHRVRLGQVFLNLVVNAAQAIPEGQEAGPHRIVLRTYVDDDGRPVAEVEDTGGGIDPAIQARIFDPFFTTKPIGVGTGLGLSSALGIVSSLGGTIDVDSRIGAGTIMRVRFPRPTDSASPTPQPRSIEAEPRSAARKAPSRARRPSRPGEHPARRGLRQG